MFKLSKSRQMGIAPILMWPRQKIFGTLGVLVLVVIALSYGIFLFGRSGIGFEDSALRMLINERDTTIEELRAQVAELATIKESQQRERQVVSKTIGELQGQVAKQLQQIEFYKGIVIKDADRPEVEIREFRLNATPSPRVFSVRLTLAKSGKSDSLALGEVRFYAEGLRAGRPSRLDLLQLPYSFRFFKNMEPTIQIPADFTPERLSVNLHSAGEKKILLTQSLVWAVF